MKEKIIIDNLSENSVSVKRQKYTKIDGNEFIIGLPNRKAYVNSIRGREELVKEVPEKYVNIVLLVWGDIPTIVEE